MWSKVWEFLEESGIAGGLGVLLFIGGFVATAYAICCVVAFTGYGVYLLTKGFIPVPWIFLTTGVGTVVIDFLLAFMLWYLFNRPSRR